MVSGYYFPCCGGYEKDIYKDNRVTLFALHTHMHEYKKMRERNEE